MNRFLPPPVWRFIFLLLAAGIAHRTSTWAQDSVATLPPGQTSTTVSFDSQPGKTIMVPLRINGQGPFLFLLDTGANVIVLDEVLARKLKLKPEGQSGTAHGMMGTQHLGYWSTEAATLQIGDATLAKQRLAAIDFSPVSSSFKATTGQDVYGSLGWDFFDQFVVRVDAVQGTMTLSLPTPDAPERGGEVLPLRFNGDHGPFIKGTVDGIEGTFLVDTGCGYGLMLTDAFIKEHQLREKFGSQLRAETTFGVGGDTKTQASPPMLLKIGSFVTKDPVIFMPEGKGASGRDSDGIVGTPMLANGVVTFDYRHKRLFIEPASDPTVKAAFSLGVGDPAPPFQVETMVKGDAVDLAKGMHVVEFWTTGSEACKRSSPHLTELAKAYRGKVDFTGVDIWGQGEDKLGQVKNFVAEVGAQMEYNVAFDGDAGVMSKRFMMAAGQNNLPTAFLVKDGVILWIGPPTEGLDQRIDRALDGSLNASCARAKSDKEAAGKTALRGMQQTLDKASEAKDYDKALATMDQLEASDPEMKEPLARHRFKALVRSGSPKVKAAAEAMLTGPSAKDAEVLNDSAWFILDSEGKGLSPDYTAAVLLAEGAAKASVMKDSSILDVYAFALFKSGDKKKAVEVQTQAVELAKTQDPNGLQEMQHRLQDFQKSDD